MDIYIDILNKDIQYLIYTTAVLVYPKSICTERKRKKKEKKKKKRGTSPRGGSQLALMRLQSELVAWMRDGS